MKHTRTVDVKKIFQKLQKYDVITFDIFDTLVKRDVSLPNDVFSLVEKEYNRTNTKHISGFSHIRQIAEKRARDVSRYAEVTLDEIYKETSYSIGTQEILKKIEADIEIMVCTPHQPIVEIYHRLLHMGKRIFLISDMYLPRPVIEKILQKCQISGYEQLWLSSEYRCRKTTGLFCKFLDSVKLKEEKIIHIGDSWKADRLAIWKSANFNYHTLLISRNTETTSHTSESANIVASFIRNHLPKNQCYFYRIGYSVYGPLLYAFVDWIIKELKKNDISNILFLSRDCYIIQKAYDIVCDTPCLNSYFCLSRRSIFATRLQGDYSIENVIDKVHFRVDASVESILRHMDAYSTENVQLASQMGIDLNATVPIEKKKGNTWQYLEKVNDKLIGSYQTRARLFEDYLSQFVHQNDRVAVIDVGWNGTAQRAIEIAQMNLSLNTNTYGYYLGVNKREFGREADIAMKGFLVDEETSEEQRIHMKAYMGFLEFFLSAPHGMTTGYIRHDNEIIPKMDKYEYLLPDGSSKKEIRILNELQAGALDFIKEMKASGIVNYIEWDREEVTAPLFSLCINPKREDLKCFGDIDFYDTSLFPMAKPKSLFHYMVHPRELKKDFARSTWKPGFMKRLLFNLPLPYYSVYTYLLKKFNK